jgi:cytochrome c
MVVPVIVFIATVLSALAPPALAQDQKGADTQAGQLIFNNACRTCHSMKEGDSRLGPHLHGIIGRKAGAVADFQYSEAMKRGDVVWDEATLDRFIANPEAVAPGNRMKPFGGMASTEERSKLIAYLKSAG